MTPETTDSVHEPKPPNSPSVLDAEARVLELRREADASEDRSQKALLLYEAGYITETELAQPAQAVQHYLSAYNHDQRFRLPLYALLRMFERRRSFKNLSRLYDAELRSARTPTEKAIASIDQAALSAFTSGDHEVVRACLERALELDPSVEAQLLLEYNRRAAGDDDGALHALMKRAESTDDPVHRGVLLLEVAAHRERRGEVGAALETLKSAALGPSTHERFLEALARFARKHNFVPELVEATERRAELLGIELKERQSVRDPDHALIELLRAQAIALWYEAARLRCMSLSDAEGALACVEKALSMRPDDVLLRQTRMLAYDLMEDRKRAADEARALLALGIEGEHAAALHFRLAEEALVRGDGEAARESLMEAIAQAGGSIAATAILDDLLLDEERHRDRVERREMRAVTADPLRASRFLLEAAQIAAHDLKDAEKASELFRKADAKSEGNLEVLREAYGAAFELQDAALARFAIDKLLARDLDDDERAALLHHRIDVASTPEEALSLIEANLADARMSAFLPHIARVRAAEAKHYPLLARAHELIAEHSVTPEEQAAHLCGAARATLRASDLPRARALLEQALARVPGHRYAMALLEEVLRQSGEGEQVVALLRRAAEAQGDARDAELSLLHAGAAAEHAGDYGEAAQSYQEAAERNPDSASAPWALLRLAQRTGSEPLELVAREALAQREQASQRAGVESLLLADHYDLVANQPELALHMLSSVLDDEEVGPHAALGILLSRAATPELREKATRVLAERATPQGKAPWLRELGLAQALVGGERDSVVDLVERVASVRGEDRWAAATRVSVPTPGAPREHSSALATFALVTNDPGVEDVLRAEALYAARLAGQPNPIVDDLAALGVQPTAPMPQHVAEVIGAYASPLDDAALCARVLATCAAAATSAESRAELTRATVRARLRGGEHAEALAALEQELAEDPDDVAALELLRVAARRAGRFDLVAQSAEALARKLVGPSAGPNGAPAPGSPHGELWAELLEEAAAAHMDYLDDPARAEALLGEVLARYPARSIAYGRMHDLVSERGDTAKLIALVEARTELVDEAEELAPLFYELARLHRASGDLEAALDALDHLAMLEEHVGGLALAVEIHTARESWREAVEALEALAAAQGVPPVQRRLARLGAADFLLNRLHDGEGALAQLERLVTEGHGDIALYTRIADVADKLGKAERAAEALLTASELAKGDARIDLTLRAAATLARAGDVPRAMVLYQRTIEAKPGHLEAVRQLLALTNDATVRGAVLARFETAVRAEARAQPLEPAPLRKLVALAELKREEDIALIALTTLVTLGAATQAERESADAAVRRVFGARPNPKSPLTQAELRELFAPAIDEKYASLLRSVLGYAAEIDQLEPGRFGVGRGQRVSPREPSQVREEAAAMCQALGIKLGDFYVGGEDATRIAALPRDDELALVVGIGVTAPLSATRRYQLALQIAGYALSSLPLLTRTPVQAARLVFAAMVAADAPLSPQIIREELGELPRTLSRALPRKVKKAIPELVRALPDGGLHAESHCRSVLRHTRRLALLLSGDLEAALESVVGAMPTQDAIAGSEEALDLVRAYTGAPMATLRKRLGLAR